MIYSLGKHIHYNGNLRCLWDFYKIQDKFFTKKRNCGASLRFLKIGSVMVVLYLNA
jgi:hypothetical protein